MVVDHGKSVYRASRDLKIHNSTAKAIIRNYKRKGRIYKRKAETVEEESPDNELSQRINDNPSRPKERNGEALQERLA